MYSTSFTYEPDAKIEYSETDEKKEYEIFYFMEKTGEHTSRLTIEFYVRKGWLTETLFNLTSKKKMEAGLHQSLHKLDGLLKDIQIPAEF